MPRNEYDAPLPLNMFIFCRGKDPERGALCLRLTILVPVNDK